MPNCTTVVQTANDLCEHKIRLNSHFSALYLTQKAPKKLQHCSVNEGEAFALPTLVIGVKIRNIENFQVLWRIPDKNRSSSSKIYKITFGMQRSMCKMVTYFKSLQVSKLINLK